MTNPGEVSISVKQGACGSVGRDSITPVCCFGKRTFGQVLCNVATVFGVSSTVEEVIVG